MAGLSGLGTEKIMTKRLLPSVNEYAEDKKLHDKIRELERKLKILGKSSNHINKWIKENKS